MFGMPDVFDIVNQTTDAMKQRRNVETAMRMWITTSDPASKQFLESNGIVVPPSVQQLQQQQQQLQQQQLQQQQRPPVPPGVIVTPTTLKKTPPRIAPSASSASQYVKKQEKHVFIDTHQQATMVQSLSSLSFEDKLLHSLADPAVLATSFAGAILAYISTNGSTSNRLAMSLLGATVPVISHSLIAV